MSSRNRNYPHLLKDDIDLWIDFLNHYAAVYDSFEYDLKVGEGRKPEQHHPPNIQQMASDLSRRRIDVVAKAPNQIHLIEITQSAGFTAIGQCVVYPILYSLQHPATQEVVPIILCREVQTDIKACLDCHGVHYAIIPKLGTHTMTHPLLRSQQRSEQAKGAISEQTPN